jgi:intein/homing endonuclease
VLTIELEDGAVVRCTPNHLFMTAEGEWRRFEYREGETSLKIGDCLRTASKRSVRISKFGTELIPA